MLLCVLEKAEMYLTLPEETGKEMDRLWMQLKRADSWWGLVTAVVGVIAIACLGWYVVLMFRKRGKR